MKKYIQKVICNAIIFKAITASSHTNVIDYHENVSKAGTLDKNDNNIGTGSGARQNI